MNTSTIHEMTDAADGQDMVIETIKELEKTAVSKQKP
jgi:hypothetical protein